MITTYTYPPMPTGANDAVIKPSASFKSSVLRVMLAMLLFITTYIVLFALALAIALGLGALGIGLLVLKATFITLVLCGGFIACGIMLIYFLIKFLFKRSQNDVSGKLEVTEDEQPHLFEFIRKVTTEAGAPFPRRIFLSPEVNASVFYDSSFWSMFLPVKKNLNIGLGLVNVLNLSEFKSVMAHEFGHFSQRSMKFGSYVYNMNRVIYNMLYDNEGYGQAINAIAGIHYLIRLGILLNLQLIRGIQFILRQVYTVINKQYMGLSRQMEFHADAVAAYVAGSNHGINSLNRLELGNLCYNNAVDLLNKLAANKQRTANLYKQHSQAISIFSNQQFLELDGAGLPIIDRKLPALNNNEIEVDNQWASHPSDTDRQDKLQKINLPIQAINTSAWAIFANAEQLQQQLTNILYNEEAANYKIVSDDDIAKFRSENELDYVYNGIYRGYYNDRLITEFNLDEVAANADAFGLSLHELLTDQNCNLPKRVAGLQADISLLEAIDTATHIKTFDFRGYKYGRHDTALVKNTLNDELEQAQKTIEEIDKQLFVACYKAFGDREFLLTSYRNFYKCQKDYSQKVQVYGQMMEQIAPIYQTRPYEEIEKQLEELYKQEKIFKDLLLDLLEDQQFTNVIKTEHRTVLGTYLEKQLVYFDRPAYDEAALELLNKAVDAYLMIVSQHYYLEKRDLLEMQLSGANQTVEVNN